MEYIQSVNQLVKKKEGTGNWIVYGYLESNENGEILYTEYAKQNQKNINELPEEVRTYLLQVINSERQPLIQVTQEDWDKIPKDYKGVWERSKV